MKKFVQYEKLSKSKKRELDRKKRVTWGNVNPGTTTARNLIDEIEKNEIEVENKDQVLSELKKVADDDENNESIVSFKVYTVKSGDTLLSICEKNRVDYENNKMIILSLNGIYDPNFICTGQKILLPIS